MITIFKQKKSTTQLVKEIHEDFFTEVDRLLEESRSFHSLETTKQDLIDKSNRLTKLGFNNKEVEDAKIEINRIKTLQKENDNKKQLIEAINYFSQKYPLYKFITEDSVKKICQKYNLIYGEVKYYKGIVPDKNLKKIEEFSIKDEDKCFTSTTFNGWSRPSVNAYIDYNEHKRIKEEYKTKSLFDPLGYKSSEFSPLEIAAPSSDFDLDNMKIEDFKIEKNVQKIPDPIVLQPIFYKNSKYYLIVTAWGPEASDELTVNQRMN